jgi:hypothetical protein
MTQYWLLNEFLYKPNGKTLELKYSSMRATFAYVPSWDDWGKSHKFLHANHRDYTPPPGAFVLYDWHRHNADAQADAGFENHIGCFLRVDPSGLYICAEGNTDRDIVLTGRTAIKKRPKSLINAFVVIPEGWRPE